MTTATIAPAASDQISPARRRLALFALALGGFGIGGSEFVSMGLLPGIAHGLLPDLMASDPETGIARAGIAISAYALGVVVGAPILALLSVRWSRSSMIVALAGALALGTLLSAAMPTFELTVAARFLAGIPHGAYFGVASLLAASLMGPGSQGKGVALALSGLTVANLLGVPVLTAIGQAAGWRAVYLVLTGVFLATVLALRATIPAHEKPIGRRMVDELVALRRVQLWIVMGIAAVGFAGSFAVFSYVSDITTQVTGAPESAVPWVLVAAGLGMTIGNVVGGAGADRSLQRTLMVGFPGFILALVLLFAVAHTNLVALMVAFFLVNLANASLNPGHADLAHRHRAALRGARRLAQPRRVQRRQRARRGPGRRRHRRGLRLPLDHGRRPRARDHRLRDGLRDPHRPAGARPSQPGDAARHRVHHHRRHRGDRRGRRPRGRVGGCRRRGGRRPPRRGLLTRPRRLT
jgi:DHA1 family inner membrane transport protein